MTALNLMLWSSVIAIPMGLILASIRLLRIPGVSLVAVAVIEFFRSLPLVVLVVWFFYAFPVLANWGVNPFVAATLAIGLQFSAFFAEIFRGGILSVPRGQWDAAYSLGMDYLSVMRWIVLPQGIRRMIPVLFALSIDLLKSTSVAASITLGELTYNAARIASETFRPIETFLVVGAIYLCAIVPMSLCLRRLERRFHRANFGR